MGLPAAVLSSGSAENPDGEEKDSVLKMKGTFIYFLLFSNSETNTCSHKLIYELIMAAWWRSLEQVIEIDIILIRQKTEDL